MAAGYLDTEWRAGGLDGLPLHRGGPELEQGFNRATTEQLNPSIARIDPVSRVPLSYT